MSLGSVGNAAGGFPGLLSQFDLSAAEQALAQSAGTIPARYQQLGLGQTGATPTDPGSFGAGGTAMQMDLGELPSLTGGLAGESQAALGQLQTEDIAQSLALGRSNLTQTAGNKGGLLTGVGSLIGK